MPCAYRPPASSATAPDMITTGMPSSLATFATPIGVLPKSVWKSVRPSPVMTRAAPSICSLSRTVSTTMSTPRLRLAPRNAVKPAPSPPAAPAPGMPSTSTPKSRRIAEARFLSASSSVLTISGVAPFCGPYTADAPCGPVKGLSTSHAATNSD